MLAILCPEQLQILYGRWVNRHIIISRNNFGRTKPWQLGFLRDLNIFHQSTTSTHLATGKYAKTIQIIHPIKFFKLTRTLICIKKTINLRG